MIKKNIIVSIIIPTFNRDLPLVKTIESVFAQDFENYELIVIDQSTKSSKIKKDFIERNRGRILYLKSSVPNAALARNIGAKNAKGKILLFLDDDVICHKDLITNHLKNYQDPKVAAVGGRVLTRGQDNKKNISNTGKISFLGSFTDGFSSINKQQIQTVISCNASFDKQIFDSLGGFDANLSLIREESDLCLRITKKGYKIIYEPSAVVDHLRADTGGYRMTDNRLNWFKGFFKSETYFFLKHRPFIIVPLILITRIKFALRCMFGRNRSLKSLITPISGIYQGFLVFFKTKYGDRS